MERDRLAAFSDGVMAVIITIMVLDLSRPEGHDWEALVGLLPDVVTYLLSFIYVAIYWNNHHHFFHLVPRVNGAILWANMNLLFWLSLIPFATSWVGSNFNAPVPTAAYGVALLMTAMAWYIMQSVIIHAQGAESALAKALGRDVKGRISPLLYLAGILAAFVNCWVSDAIYAAVALMWVIPDRRIEGAVE
jgi:uncharacterized membrane protein